MGGAFARATGGQRLIALVGVGATTLALPGDAVREVAPWPTRVTPAAGAAAPTLGFFRLRAEALPLYDLGAGLGLTPPKDDGAGRRMVAIVDVARAGRLGRVGLAIDAAYGVARLAERHVTPLARGADGAPSLSLAGADDAVTLYLDAASLARLPNLLVADIDAAAAPRVEATAAPILLFAWRGMALATPVKPLREIISAPVYEPLRTRSDSVSGATLVRGDRVATLDLDAALGRAASERAQAPLALVFDGADIRFAAPAERVLGLCDLNDCQRAPFPRGAVGPDGVAEALVAPDGRPALLLDIERLGRRADLRALAQKLAPPRRAVESGFGAPIHLAKMLAGGAIYAELSALIEVTELPRDALFLTERADELAGFARHRGAVAPILDLRRHLGADATARTGAALRVAMVGGRARPVGLIIDGVDGVERLRLDVERQPPSAEGLWAGVSALARPSVRFAAARDGARPKTIKVVDVAALAARVDAAARGAAHAPLS